MTTYSISNNRSGWFLGNFTAESPFEAIEVLCQEAGYASVAAAAGSLYRYHKDPIALFIADLAVKEQGTSKRLHVEIEHEHTVDVDPYGAAFCRDCGAEVTP